MDGHVGVIGAGTMGAGIAQVALEAGHDVRLFDTDTAAVERARDRIRSGLTRRLTRTADDPLAIRDLVDVRLSRLAAAGSLAEAAEDAQLVIEAAVEDLGVKRRVFAVLDAAAPAEALLASNTSALSIGTIATATRHPGRVLGLHFFNPAPVMELVEVIAGPRTEEGAMARGEKLMAAWGKTPIRSADLPGFIVNRVNRPFTVQALRILESARSTIDVVDRAMRDAGFPMGPFELMDLIGIDVNLAVTRAIHRGFLDRGDPDADRFRPSQVQEDLVAAGELGRKTGSGFYRYLDGGASEPADGFAVTPGGNSLTADAIVERIRLAIVERGDAGGRRRCRTGGGHRCGHASWRTAPGRPVRIRRPSRRPRGGPIAPDSGGPRPADDGPPMTGW